PYYQRCPEVVQAVMDRFGERLGRRYQLFEYAGAADAERVVVIMGSGAETTRETVRFLCQGGDKVGVVTVRLFRPFLPQAFARALPASVKAVAVLDRTKEPGATGEPLYTDVVTAMHEAMADGSAPFGGMPRVIGGRYGLSSKEFTPAMVKGIFDELAQAAPRVHFTVGINDDVTGASISYDDAFSIEDPKTVRCVFYGLGSDGTVGANKNSIKIIGEETDHHAQGYFVYDSKKAGAVTVSHLRFGDCPIRAPYLIRDAQFVACHQFTFLERIDVLKTAAPGAVFLLNCPFGPDEAWDNLPREVQEDILAKKLRFHVIDAQAVATEAGLGHRINTVMQTCFFALAGVLPKDEAVKAIKSAIRKTYGHRGDEVVQRNFQAVDAALAHLHEVAVPAAVTAQTTRRPPVPATAPAFVKEVLAPMIARNGDSVPVSALPADGTYPAGTTRFEKRNLALEIPVWEPDLCIQCGKCVFVCPHAVIRQKVVAPETLAGAPAGFLAMDGRFREFPGARYTLQVAPEDCTGCTLCVEACPIEDKKQPGRKALNMAPQAPLRDSQRENWEFFVALPEADRGSFRPSTVKTSQLLEPLFEFSGACAGCGETPYLKLVTQLFGERTIVANATGCSSIYGGNLPTTPWAANKEGRGPAWSNSLFEDNAEFGLGMRLAVDKQRDYAAGLLAAHEDVVGSDLVKGLQGGSAATAADVQSQWDRVRRLKSSLEGHLADPWARDLHRLADVFVDRSVWIVGGDGWAYDIGYGGLDHVLASGANVNVLVLNTGAYSNTGGQASKATPLGAVARFAAQGKATPTKDLGLMAMAYGYVYVAQVAFGASDQKTLQAFLEADAYAGPSLIVAYAPCIVQGLDLKHGLTQQALAVKSGYWPLYRFNPERAAAGQAPLQLDSKAPSVPFAEFAAGEGRFRSLESRSAGRAADLMAAAQKEVDHRWALYRQLASAPPSAPPSPGKAPAATPAPPDDTAGPNGADAKPRTKEQPA
ncbi:MAG: pyruvate:ferredoxin (flavodoxin) oxidoreductase, partial [Anaerolineae bacterium]